MNDQYPEKQCDICRQPSYDGNPVVETKCQHLYHRKCLPLIEKINDTKCPICRYEKKSIVSIVKQETDEEENTLQETEALSIAMSNEPVTLNNSSESWSCNRCTYKSSPQSTECDMCGSPCLTDSTNKHHQMRDSQNDYDIITSSGLWSCNHCTYLNSPQLTECDMCQSSRITDSTNKYQPMVDSQNSYDLTTSSTEPSSTYTTASASASIKSSSSPLEKNPISEQILKKQGQSPLVWECEVCTYENESTISRCSICRQGKRPYTVTQMTVPVQTSEMAIPMGKTATAPSDPSTRVQWMWHSNAEPFSKSQSVDEWRLYSDIANMIIEEAYTTGKTHAMLDDYHVDLEHKVQISNNDINNQRPVKRMLCSTDDKSLREERFMPNPVAPDRPFGGQYGFISPFIKEVVKNLHLTKEQLPSKNEMIVPMIVEKAALGIIEEGKKVGEQREPEKIAQILMGKKEAGIEEVWRCCARLYSLDSFLYRKLNETMRLIGSEQHEQVWRSKIRTFGPFCLLLWDNPFDNKITKPGTTLYRGAQLSDDLIASFKDDCSKDTKPWHSFQAFTSCTRNPIVAEVFGNVLFIMKVCLAFTVDLQPFSNFFDEEEELLSPGVTFTIDKVDFDENKNKHLIYLTLQHRHNRVNQQHINQNLTQSTEQKIASRNRRLRRRHRIGLRGDDGIIRYFTPVDGHYIRDDDDDPDDGDDFDDDDFDNRIGPFIDDIIDGGRRDKQNRDDDDDDDDCLSVDSFNPDIDNILRDGDNRDWN